MTALQKAKETDKITMGNMNVEKVAEIGQIPGIFCDSKGNELLEATLNDVSLMPNNGFKLFSATKLTRTGGWKMIGESDKIELGKRQTKIIFDIVIETPKGAGFGA